MLSPQDLLVMAVVGFVLFGSNKLPEMARSVGTSINEFKKVVNGEEEAAARHAAAQAPVVAQTVAVAPPAAQAGAPVPPEPAAARSEDVTPR